ncbi:MAG: hypothetical protein V4722_21900 [Bacteroidota bacterium]
MNQKKIQLIAGILLLITAAVQQFTLRSGYSTKSHTTTMTIMAGGMVVLGILLIRKGTAKDNTNKPA